MATVRMKKGLLYADIHDSPESIKQAQLNGYSLVEEKTLDTQVHDAIAESVEKYTDKQKENQLDTKVVHKRATSKK